jgi:hypothetical protein
MRVKQMFASSLVAGVLLMGATAPGAVGAPAPESAASVKKCSRGVDQPWSGSGKAYTYGWNTCTFAGRMQFKLYRHSGGKYREVAHSPKYWSKFPGRSISAKCAKGGHWYVASYTVTAYPSPSYTVWSRAAWLGNC